MSLQATSQAPGSVFLSWNPSAILDAHGQPTNKPVLGYRVYVNDQAKGMVGGMKNHSLLEGLSSTHTYRVFLRAVSALGESPDSNVVLITPNPQDEIRLSQIADGDNDQDPSDGQHPPSHRGGQGADNSGGPGGSGQNSSHLPDSSPTSKGSPSSPSNQNSLRDSTPSRIPTLRNRNLLHVQFDPNDLESSKGSSTGLDVSKGSYTTLESSTKGSMLETDSGYLTTLGSLGNKQAESRLSTKASIAPSVAIETVMEEPGKRRTTVIERLEQKLKNPKDLNIDSKQTNSPTSTQENKNLFNKLLESERPNTPGGSSPRIQEGLIKRLEQTRDKSMLGELKYAAAKIHRRRNESPTPLRAIPSELNRAETIANEITSNRRDSGDAAISSSPSSKSRSGVVVEAPERLPKSREGSSSSEHGAASLKSKLDSQSSSSRNTEQKEDAVSSKAASPDNKSTADASQVPPRRLSDSKQENVSDPLGERKKSRSVYEEEKVKTYFSRHNSLRYRVQVARPRVRTNSGGDEQEEPEKDTPAVKKALESYRESKNRVNSSSGETETKATDNESSGSTKTVPIPAERKISPVSTAERRGSSENKRTTPSERSSPSSGSGITERRTTQYERRSPSSKLPSPSRQDGSAPSAERRTLPETPGSEKEIQRTSDRESFRTRSGSTGGSSSSSSPTKPERTPPAVPPRPSKILKESGIRTRSPSPKSSERARDRHASPLKHRSNRSREASPAAEKTRSERGENHTEIIIRRGSVRRRHPSTGSEAGEESQQQQQQQQQQRQPESGSPQKSSSDELSVSSASKSYSTSESRSTSQREKSSPSGASRNSSPSSTGIPLPSGERLQREKSAEDMVRHSRGRRSAREPRNKKVEVIQRSSSVGAVVDRITGGCCNADTVVVTDKPPVAKREGSRENIPGHKNSRENLNRGSSRENVSSNKPPISRTSSKEDVSSRRSSGRRRTHSEHSQAGSSEDDDGSLPRSGSRESFGERKSSSERSTGSGDMTEALQAALLAPANSTKQTSPREKKPLLKHKRSHSDISGIQALPDRPESPAPKDWKPAAPSKPNQAPSSPRVIRSSSFSKVLPGQDASQGSPDALLRQCISLETLKAAKSHDIGHFEAKRSSQSEALSAVNTSTTPATPPSESPPSTTGITFDKAAVVRRSLERCYGRNLERNLGGSGGSNGGVEGRSQRPHSMAYGEDLRSASDGATSAVRTQRYSDSDYDQASGVEYDEDVYEVAKEMEKLHALPSQSISDDRSLRLDELRERRTKLGSKAADLFAKLQQRLSASKT